MIFGVMMISFAVGAYALDSPADVPTVGSAEELERLNAERENLVFEQSKLQDHLDFMSFNCVGAQANPANIQRCNMAQNYVSMNKAAYERRLEVYQDAISHLQAPSM